MENAAEFHYGIKWDELSAFEQAHWKAAWFASREAIVIELPVLEDWHDPGYGSGIEHCADAIKAAGLKVKP